MFEWALGKAAHRINSALIILFIEQNEKGVRSLALQHHYDCGEYGMQLLVFPNQDRNVCFKVVDEFRTAFEVTNCFSCLHWITSNEDGAAIFSVADSGCCHVLKKGGCNHLKVQVEELAKNGCVAATHDIHMICPKLEHIPTPDALHAPAASAWPDEFGTAFEVTNCSICLHWVTSNEDRAVFSAGYQGCHVQYKNGRNHLKVRVEELTRSRRVATFNDINMVCPKPEEHILTPEDGMRHVPQPPQPGPVRPLPAQPQPGPVRPLPAQPQPGPVRPLPHLYPSIYNIGTHLTMEQCRVLGSKIPCADTYDQATCRQASCCYDDSDISTPCYYGNTVTVQCLKEGHFILVVSRDMSDYPVVLDTVKLSYAQAGCDPVRRTEAFLVFRFPLTQCGTTVQVIGDRLIYENQLISGIDIQNGPDGSITRDSTFILHARCVYNATDFLPVQAEVLLPPTPAPVSQMGPLRLELRIATDASYKSYYLDGDYPVVKVLRDPVHVEVRILQRSDPSLVLVLHDCWATPSANPLELLQWPILVDGCPFEGDNYRTQRVPPGPASSELPFPTHSQRFTISTFTFVDSGSQVLLSQLVYLFCSASACYSSQFEPCRTTCSTRSSILTFVKNGRKEDTIIKIEKLEEKLISISKGRFQW
ncbi:PREDICTED: zona pellucida sperm-binding protein 1 [Gekko japonicus]|uniref:Zona pellucida sperm-binding protein 1 n=1 Tax=Gekko japonicus TaxID=146911 RepID=A0ABM1JZI5_GEKJA|nr:PREDICTED: zona pellucida sperm-binding protein 1 [Gekko japonicus]